MNCKPCGIAIRGKKPKDDRTIWDFGGKRMLKLSQFEFRGGQRPDSEPVNFSFRKGARVNNTNATFVEFHQFHFGLANQHGYRRGPFVGGPNYPPINFHQNKTMPAIKKFELLENTAGTLDGRIVKGYEENTAGTLNGRIIKGFEENTDESLRGRIVKGYEPQPRPWMVFFQIATGNGLSLDI